MTNVIFAPKERICNVCPHKITTKPLVSPLQFLSMLDQARIILIIRWLPSFSSVSLHVWSSAPPLSLDLFLSNQKEELKRPGKVSSGFQENSIMFEKRPGKKSKMWTISKIGRSKWHHGLDLFLPNPKVKLVTPLPTHGQQFFGLRGSKMIMMGKSEKWEHLTILLMCPNLTEETLFWPDHSWAGPSRRFLCSLLISSSPSPGTLLPPDQGPWKLH